MSHPDQPLQKAVFLDKDGTLIRDVPYNVDPALVVFEAGVFEGLRKLRDEGYKLIIVSNQPGVSLGYFSGQKLRDLVRYFEEIFAENELLLTGFYYCPHLSEGETQQCHCRKPKPGLITQAAEEHQIDLRNSWMIGDILNDVEAGNRAGCSTILIDNGNETEWLIGLHRKPDYVSQDFSEAANYIVSLNVLHHA